MVWPAYVVEKISRTLCDQHEVQGSGNIGICVSGLPTFVTSRSAREHFPCTDYLRCKLFSEVETWQIVDFDRIDVN